MPDPLRIIRSTPNAAPSGGGSDLSIVNSAASEDEGWGTKAWRWAMSPLLPQISQAARGISDVLTTHHADESYGGSVARGALGGMLEGAGNVLSDFTSPFGLATAAAGPIIRGIRGAATGVEAGGLALKEALGGRAAGDVLLGGPRNAAEAANTLLGSTEVDDLLREFQRGLGKIPAGSRDVGGTVPPLGSVLPDVAEGRIPASEVVPRPPTPRASFSGSGLPDQGAPTASAFEASSAPVARPTAFSGSGLPDPGLSIIRSVPAAAAEPVAAAAPHAPLDLDALLQSIDPHVPELPAVTPEPSLDLGALPTHDPLQEFSGAPAAAEPPASTPMDTLRRFFRMDEAPVSPSGKRRLLPEEVTREQGMRATNLGESRGIPDTPSAFKASPEDPLQEWLTRDSRYRDLPADQRRAAVLNDERFSHLMGDESGFVDPAVMAEGANKLRYFSMLSSPMTQAKNVAGNVGAVLSHAAETALGGAPRDALTVLKEFFHPQTVRDAIRDYQLPEVGGRWDQTANDSVLNIPGRVMGAIDSATKDALRRGGVASDLAKEITFTNRPKSETGAALTDFLSKTPMAKLAVPFSRTATNILERGLERTPGLGYLAQALTGGAMQTSVPKQILGTIAAVAGAKYGADNPLAQAFLAPYSVPASIGAGMGGAASKANSTGADVLNGAVKSFLSMAPLPNDYSLQPNQWLASFVPNILRDVNPMIGTDPSSFDTSHSLTGAALAKIPILNELLLKKKAHAPSAAPPHIR